MRKVLLFILAILNGIHVAAAGYYVFIGSYNWDKTKEGIYVYRLDTISGSLAKITSVSNILNPAFIALPPGGNHIYACTEAHTTGLGSVSSFLFDTEKATLTYTNSQPSGGENPVYLTVHKSGRWLINANYTEGSVSVYLISGNGSIQPASQVVAFTEGSINKERQDRAHIHAAVFSPGQEYLFLPDLGADKIRCYRFDSSVAKPLQPTDYPLTLTIPGSGPRHMVFHPNNLFCYCIEELSGTITAYRYANGKLDSTQRIATHEHRVKKHYNSADIHISPDGRFLYASNRSRENNIAIFSINMETGILTHVGYQSTLGDHPRNFVIDPSGKFLLVANQLSGDVVVFIRNTKTGKLLFTGNKVKVPGASCLQIR